MPKIEFDVDTKKAFKRPCYAQLVDEFIESDHKNMLVECENRNEAINIAKGLCMYRLRKHIRDMNIMRRDSNILLTRSKEQICGES